MNTMSISVRNDGCVQTDFVCDGVISMEIHRKGLNESKVLRKIEEKKYYQYKRGNWTLTFTDEPKVITAPKFEKLMELAHEFIFVRDNTTDYSGFC